MSTLDWLVLALTLSCIIVYGLYKSRTSKDLEGYFLSNRSMPWGLVLLSIMGTQASAITFLSAPGQAFTDGMRFVQYYFGLPLAMIVISIAFVPIFSRLKVFTAYEYLEQRFDQRTRLFTSALFLLSRGITTGISIYAPSLVLSSLLGWNIYLTNVITGGLLVIYTVSGGAKAVAYTQQLQLLIIFGALFLATYFLVDSLPAGIGFSEALRVAAAAGKMNVITTGFTAQGFDWKDKYNLFSGLIGGFFLALSYFGTDQSQVGRYLTAKNLRESRLGLLMNGVVKIPMQFFILLLGVLLFAHYQFNSGPIFFNKAVPNKVYQSPQGDSLQRLERDFAQLSALQSSNSQRYIQAWNQGETNAATLRQSLANNYQELNAQRQAYKTLLKKADKNLDTNDTNYIFLRYVMDHLPHGLVGLLIAIIILAAWGSIAAALNSLSACVMADFYPFFHKATSSDENQKKQEEYAISKQVTLAWGIFSVIIAQFTGEMGSLIEVVNVLGSVFYGVILGIFLVAFFSKFIQARAIFLAAVVVQIGIIALYIMSMKGLIDLAFLWLNVIGALGVWGLAAMLQMTMKKGPN
jgi:solute:Na+ symporter, SSS family